MTRFKFKWFRPHTDTLQGGNVWYTNTFHDWNKCEARLNYLESQGLKVVWIEAQLG